MVKIISPIPIMVALVLAWTLFPAAEIKAFQSKDEVGRWFTYYYQNPEPEKVPAAVKYAGQAGLWNDKQAIPSLTGFLAGVIRANPQKVTGWVEALTPLEEPLLGAVVLGLWYANLTDSRERAYAVLDQAPNQKDRYQFLYQGSSTRIDQVSLEQGPWVLDLLWGNFMATGDKVPLVRIISALAWAEVKTDNNRLALAGAAKWSLTSNAQQHQRVREIIREEAGKQPKEIAGVLQEIIAEAEKRQTVK